MADTRRAILRAVAANDTAIKGVIFDMDGTLCLPQPWMFTQMREALGLTGKSIDILTHIDSLSAAEQVKAKQDIEDIETEAMLQMKPQPGLQPLFQFLTEQKIHKTICTRNLIKPVNHLINQHLRDVQLNEPIITRSFLPPKPSPKPLLHIIEQWGLTPKEVIMVGDSKDDMLSGLSAGCAVILIRHENNGHLLEFLPEIDCVIDTLDEVITLLQDGFMIKDRSGFDAAKSISFTGT